MLILALTIWPPIFFCYARVIFFFYANQIPQDQIQESTKVSGSISNKVKPNSHLSVPPIQNLSSPFLCTSQTAQSCPNSSVFSAKFPPKPSPFSSFAFSRYSSHEKPFSINATADAMEVELEPRVKPLPFKVKGISRESPAQKASHVLDTDLRNHWSTGTNTKEWILLELDVCVRF